MQRETLDENEAYPAAGISRETAPAAIARGDARRRACSGLPPDDPPVDAEDGLPVRVRRSSMVDGEIDLWGGRFADRSVAP
ncbi:MAG: hypothetical protein M3319_05600 [Actinomycetota bacterium]|nr:hypothetical protein [Actinomycetota bacterium]MDQ3899932.1 hypothetical protein [Actinomycetota bacterium]